MLYVLRPGDDNPLLRGESRDFIQARVSEARYEMSVTETNLTRAYAQDDDSQLAADRVRLAEEHHERACANFQTATFKLKFEDRDKGRPRIKPHPDAMPKPWITDPKRWLSIFRFRNNRDY